MSYNTISQCATDSAFLGRLAAAAAAEGVAVPEQAVSDLRWPVSTAADIAAAYESAVIGENPNPGGDESVITDQMILSAVQANMPAPPDA